MNQILANIILTFSLILLTSTSFSLIYVTAKFFNLTHAIIITAGAYFTFLFSNQFSIPFAVSVIAAITITSCIGLLCELMVYRPMRKRIFPQLSYLIASIGLYVVLQNCISLYFGDDAKILRTGEIKIGHQLLGAYITDIQIITIFVSLTLFIAVNLIFQFVAIGKSIRAVSSNPELCNIYGISSNKIILIAFVIGSALAAIAGILSAMDTSMTPTFGFNILLYGVVAMIIGGVGSIRGLIVGALLVSTAQHLAAYYIDTKWMNAITYIILILFLIWKPLGFNGKLLKKVEI